MSNLSGADDSPMADQMASSASNGRVRYRSDDRGAVTGYSLFWPVAIFFASGLAWSVFQGIQLHEEGKNLAALKGGQQSAFDQAQKVHKTLDALATETKKLGDAGNANAKLVIEEMRKRGITVNAPTQGLTPTK